MLFLTIFDTSSAWPRSSPTLSLSVSRFSFIYSTVASPEWKKNHPFLSRTREKTPVQPPAMNHNANNLSNVCGGVLLRSPQCPGGLFCSALCSPFCDAYLRVYGKQKLKGLVCGCGLLQLTMLIRWELQRGGKWEELLEQNNKKCHFSLVFFPLHLILYFSVSPFGLIETKCMKPLVSYPLFPLHWLSMTDNRQ